MPFVLVIWIGVWLRWPGMWANSFHADEALFATWARHIGVWKDPLLVTQVVDKPPLLFYLQAIFYPLLATPAGWPARMPNFIAFILIIPLTARLSWLLYKEYWLSFAAAALISLSPLAIQFTATAFTDPLLTTLLTGALVALLQKRPGWSGVLFGLALATKYQAILLFPLLLLLGLTHEFSWRRWLIGFLPWPALIVWWDVLRTGSFTLWTNQVASYGGVAPVWHDSLWANLRDWQYLSGFLLGPAILLFLFPAALLLWLRRDKGRYEDFALSTTIVLYAAVHLLIGAPAWDRYLLPVLPLLLILLARLWLTVTQGPRRLAGSWRLVLGVVTIALLLGSMWPGAAVARRGGHTLGGYPTADSGAAAAAAALDGVPWGTVLYDRDYSWHWRFHFLDQPVFVNWHPSAISIAGDLAVHGHDDTLRYLAWPVEETGRVLARDLAAVGFRLELIGRFEQINLYQIVPLDS